MGIFQIDIDYDSLTENISISKEEFKKQLEEFPFKKEFRKSHGFNTATDKDLSFKNQYLMTDYFAGYKTVINKKTGRINKKEVYKPIFESLDQAFQFSKAQRQVFSGLNHRRRDIVVVDVDCDPPCFSADEMTQAVGDVLQTCDLYQIPYPSYVEFHTDSGHYQIGWYLTPYFLRYGYVAKVSQDYNFLLKSLAVLFEGDRNFKGGNIKNPYHEKNIPFFLDLTPINPEIFFKKFEEFQLFQNCTAIANIYNDLPHDPTELMKLYDPKDSVGNSRNCYAYVSTIKWVFRYRRENKHKSPSFIDTKNAFIAFEIESLKYNGKTSIEDDGVINRSVQGVLSFCNRVYNPNFMDPDSEIQRRRRESSALTRSTQKAIHYFKASYLKNKNLSQRSIASKLGCTQATISNLLKNSETDCINTLIDFKIKHGGSPKKTKQEILYQIDYILKSLEDSTLYDLSDYFEELKM